ncbi:hypothetical protein JG687_00006401, partial [Phytophthora cactorum]
LNTSELQLAGADLCDGSCGPTKSAAAYATSPWGMFFYFLPKMFLFLIESETNKNREECIPEIARQQRKQQLQAQAKDPRKSVATLDAFEE